MALPWAPSMVLEPGFPKYKFDRNAAEATVKFTVDPGDFGTVYDALFPQSSASSGTITVGAPESFPVSGLGYLYADTMTAEPVGEEGSPSNIAQAGIVGPTELYEPSKVFCTVVFRPFDYGDSDLPSGGQSFSGTVFEVGRIVGSAGRQVVDIDSGEAASDSDGGLFWVDTGVTPDDKRRVTTIDAFAFYSTSEITISLSRVPSVNFVALDRAIGKCNNATVSCRHRSYYAEQMLFSGYRHNQTIETNGARPWSIDLNFSVKEFAPTDTHDTTNYPNGGGWNHYLEPTGRFSDLKARRIVDINNNPLIPLGDFSDIVNAFG